jgi:hypothetical protein
VVAELPTSSKERNDLVFSAFSGRDVPNLPKYYRDYAQTGQGLLAKAKTLDFLRNGRPIYREPIARWLTNTGRAESSVVWLPLQARKADLVMMLDAKTAEPLQALAIDPW